MFLVFTLVLLVVAIGILSSVYSIFFPFMQNLGTVQQYHQAYYGAVSSVERASLVLRYREPWFEWSGWLLWITGYGPLSDYTPELLFRDHEWLIWQITSRTTTIPSPGMGNTDPMFATGDSSDYNKLGYHYLESFLLSYDQTSDVDMYYTWWSDLFHFGNPANITWVLRLPPKIFSVFGWSWPADLCDSYVGVHCDPDRDGIYDDVVVSRSLEGRYAGQGFKIFPTISVFYYSGMWVDTLKDNAIRESIINAGGNITFWPWFTPVSNGGSLTKHNVVSAVAGEIEGSGFSQIFNSSSYTWLRLSFGATNLFRSFTGAIYPYLEYQFTFPQEIADRFYTIQWQGRVGEYDVKILLRKPTVEGTVGGDFTVIF